VTGPAGTDGSAAGPDGPAGPVSVLWDRLGLARRHTALRLARYSAVSVVATTTSLVTLGVLVGVAGMAAVWANVVATAVGTVPSFELNRRWVWRADGRRSVLGQVVPFAVLSATGLVVSTVAVGAAAARTATWGHTAHTAAVLCANVAAYGSLWVVQYALLDKVLFRTRAFARPARHPGPGPVEPPRLVGAVSGRSGPDGPRPGGPG